VRRSGQGRRGGHGGGGRAKAKGRKAGEKGDETPAGAGGGAGPLNVRTFIVIAVVLALGLVFFYAFSAPYGDGLEMTMEEGEAEEGEAAFEAPLTYGEDHFTSFVMGLVGFAVLVVVFLGVGRALPDKGKRA
jgi:hypothetical protein